jgi:hypothetical protein
METRRSKKIKTPSLGKLAKPGSTQWFTAELEEASKGKRRSVRLNPRKSPTLKTSPTLRKSPSLYLTPSPSKSTRKRKAAAATILKFFRGTKHTRKARFLEALCSDAGVCLAFGQHTGDIKQHFSGFTAFNYVIPPIKRIGQPSENGFINQIEYEHRGYKSYAILKSAKTPNADNLLYEYIVGLYMNQLNKQYPCFLETYGYYMYNNDKYWKRLQKDKPVTDISILKKGLTFFKDVDFYNGCKSSQQIAILIQHLKNIQSLDDLSREPDFIQNELMWVLYQLYAPLGKLKNNFTHYDLHMNNIYIYEPVAGSYIEYHYYDTTSTVSFKSSYMLKIIDYGRSFFKDDLNNTDSKHIYETQLCPEEECNEPEDERGTCGSHVGFAWLEELSKKAPEKQYYISSQQRNMSHDLLPLTRIKENNTAPSLNQLTPELNALVNKVVYKDYFGTPEKTSGGYPIKIVNVGDAAHFIKMYLMNKTFKTKNEEVNAGKTKLGDLHVYMDGRPMEFVPYVKTI